MTNAKLEVSAELFAEMKEYLSYNPKTGFFTWIKKHKYMRRNVGDIADVSNSKAMYLSFNGKKHQIHRLAWLFYYGYMPKEFIDHIDGNPFNNKINNLREATNAENQQNQRKPKKDSKSGFLGVTWNSQTCKYYAKINKQKQRFYLGCFDCPKEAHEAYLKAKRELHPFCTI